MPPSQGSRRTQTALSRQKGLSESCARLRPFSLSEGEEARFKPHHDECSSRPAPPLEGAVARARAAGGPGGAALAAGENLKLNSHPSMSKMGAVDRPDSRQQDGERGSGNHVNLQHRWSPSFPSSW